jgi:hypothetical protein
VKTKDRTTTDNTAIKSSSVLTIALDIFKPLVKFNFPA